jgi:hypothetical protein
MKISTTILLSLCAVLSSVVDVSAQKSPWKVEVTDLKIEKQRGGDTGNRVPGVPADTKSEWVRITAEFDLLTARGKGNYGNDAKWLDEAEFEWTIVLPKATSSGGKPSESRSVRSTKKFTYGNISEGEKHHVVIYLHPRVYERHKDGLTRDLAFVRLRVKIAGKTHEEAYARGRSFTNSTSEARRLFPEFRKAVWFDSEDVKQIQNALVPRYRTPWVGVGENYYEQIIKEH